MPHGDFSDLAAVVSIVGGISNMVSPNVHLGQLAFLQPYVGVADEATLSPQVDALMRMFGGLLLIIGCMLFTVRWNTINGKLSGLACIIFGANTAHVTYYRLDQEVLVPRPFYVYAAVLTLGGLHLMFNANPLIKERKD